MDWEKRGDDLLAKYDPKAAKKKAKAKAKSEAKRPKQKRKRRRKKLKKVVLLDADAGSSEASRLPRQIAKNPLNNVDRPPHRRPIRILIELKTKRCTRPPSRRVAEYFCGCDTGLSKDRFLMTEGEKAGFSVIAPVPLGPTPPNGKSSLAT